MTVPPEPPLDESWAEPMAFDGCSTQGQARPGQPQSDPGPGRRGPVRPRRLDIQPAASAT